MKIFLQAFHVTLFSFEIIFELVNSRNENFNYAVFWKLFLYLITGKTFEKATILENKSATNFPFNFFLLLADLIVINCWKRSTPQFYGLLVFYFIFFNKFDWIYMLENQIMAQIFYISTWFLIYTFYWRDFVMPWQQSFNEYK